MNDIWTINDMLDLQDYIDINLQRKLEGENEK